MTTLEALEPPAFFEMPWRTGLDRFGKLLSVSSGSCRVKVPTADGEGWDELNVSRTTQVLPATEEDFLSMDLRDLDTFRVLPKSTVESPVKVVHRICSELCSQFDDDKSFRQAVWAECAKQGINLNTAKTQYYVWRKAQR